MHSPRSSWRSPNHTGTSRQNEEGRRTLSRWAISSLRCPKPTPENQSLCVPLTHKFMLMMLCYLSPVSWPCLSCRLCRWRSRTRCLDTRQILPPTRTCVVNKSINVLCTVYITLLHVLLTWIPPWAPSDTETRSIFRCDLRQRWTWHRLWTLPGYL